MQSQLLRDGPWPRQASMETEDEDRLSTDAQRSLRLSELVRQLYRPAWFVYSMICCITDTAEDYAAIYIVMYYYAHTAMSLYNLGCKGHVLVLASTYLYTV